MKQTKPKRKEMILCPIPVRTATEPEKQLVRDVEAMERFRTRHAITAIAKVRSNAPPAKARELSMDE